MILFCHCTAIARFSSTQRRNHFGIVPRQHFNAFSPPLQLRVSASDLLWDLKHYTCWVQGWLNTSLWWQRRSGLWGRTLANRLSERQLQRRVFKVNCGMTLLGTKNFGEPSKEEDLPSAVTEVRWRYEGYVWRESGGQDRWEDFSILRLFYM